MRRRRQTHGKWMVAGALILLVANTTDAAVMSTQEFVKSYARWPQLAKAKSRIIVEGRYSSRAGSSIRLQKCEVLFHAASGTRLPTITDRKANIEFSGYLKRSSGRYLFIVERHSTRPSDKQRLTTKRIDLLTASPAKWYELGQQAAKTAKFFDDKELRREADSILLEGVRREKRRLQADDVAGMRTLAERIREFKLGDQHRLELLHDALWIEWRALKKTGLGLDSLLKQTVKDFPGADKPLQALDIKERKSYLDSPGTTYRKAGSDDRPRLQRMFYTAIRLDQIERTAAPDGRNGYEIAKLIETQIPELKQLPDEYRHRELTRESARIARLSQAEMRRLKKRYLDIGDPQAAESTVLKWVQSLAARHRARGPSGLIKTADLYRDELGDRKKEAELLQEAWSQLVEAPLERDREELARRLKLLGWSLRERQWVEGPAPQDRPVSQPVGVTVGMTPDQVRKALNGPPTSKTRIASKDKTTELWIYRDTGLVVQFDHPVGGATTVVKVKGLR
jgi:hypothetical protein